MPGSAAVAELIGLRAAVAAASVVVTGEGSFDGQSAAGKVPAHVAALAAEAGTPVALVAGRIAADADVSAFAGTASLTELAGSARGGHGRSGALAHRGRGRAGALARLTSRMRADDDLPIIVMRILQRRKEFLYNVVNRR